MDFTLNGLLRHYALVLMLLEVQGRPVIPAPTPTSCDFNSIKPLTEVLRHLANQTLNEYIQFHGHVHGSVPNDVPTSTISGITISEKLQDVYIKNVLFHFHISKVIEYHETFPNLSNSLSVARLLSSVKGNLGHHGAQIRTHLKDIDSLPITPAPPQLSHSDGYAKKKHGWGVIVNLKDWLERVSEVLTEENKLCDKSKQGHS